MKHRTAGVTLALLTALASALPAQAPPPDGDWRTFETAHFRVTYQAELAALARQAAAVAERTHDVLSRELAAAPRGTIDLVVVDHADYSNGLARLFPSNRIVVFARPPATGEFNARDWLELVVAHEVVHAFHLEPAGSVGRAVRAVFGRVPLVWPVFPVAGTPAWSVEGLAVHYETRLTGAGRVRASLHDMVIRTAALEHGIPDLDALSAPNPVWPAGNRSYIYGARFMRHIADTYGPEAHRALIDATTGSLWPTFLRFDHVAADAVGASFEALYAEWRAVATDTAEAVARRVRAAGVTETRPVAGRGPYAVAPRVSPDGRHLAFAASDWRTDPATRLVDLGTDQVRFLAERNQLGSILDGASWFPDGSGVVVGQLDFVDPYRLFSDLWRVDIDGRETRLTRGSRLAQPDVGPNGRRVAAVQNQDGATSLAVYDLETGEVRVLAAAGPGESFDRPRWSPDGRRIAAARHMDGRTDLVVVDAVSGAIDRVTDDTALDMAPAWSPDGRWLLWWSDRTGIPNIMAIAVEDGRPAGVVRQVTNVVTGVIDPEVGPDGETLYLTAYHADGWRIEATPFDPAGWAEAPAPENRYEDAILPAPERPAAEPSAEPAADAAYSPWPTLRPFHWLPTWEVVGQSPAERLRFLGAAVAGHDVLARHDWALRLAADIDTGRLQGGGRWVYRGLANPDLFASFGRDWLVAGSATVDGNDEPFLLRDDQLTVGAVFHRRRWRSRAAVQVAADLERQTFEARNLSRAELASRGLTLRQPPTLAGVSVRPAFNDAVAYPFSISVENGISVSGSVGRWWDTGSGVPAYDEVAGRVTRYVAAPIWGFANHVFVVRGAGFLRSGRRPPVRGIGGLGLARALATGSDAASSYPVRGFGFGDRFGTRAWTAGAEWRFPIRLWNVPGRFLGFSLISLSGSLFADAGNAWCTEADRAREGLAGCYEATAPSLLSAGAELGINIGVFHNTPVRLVAGVARPVRGPGEKPVFYLGTTF